MYPVVRHPGQVVPRGGERKRERSAVMKTFGLPPRGLRKIFDKVSHHACILLREEYHCSRTSILSTYNPPFPIIKHRKQFQLPHLQYQLRHRSKVRTSNNSNSYWGNMPPCSSLQAHLDSDKLYRIPVSYKHLRFSLKSGDNHKHDD